MDRLTVIIVPDETREVRRFQVPRALVRRGAIAGALCGLLLLAGFADYVRLRLAAVDVAELREEVERDKTWLGRLAADVNELQGRLTDLSEFERKARVIAGLPVAIEETPVPVAPPEPGTGQGGDEEESDPEPEIGGEPAPLPRHEGDGIDRVALERASQRARQLEGSLSTRGDSLADLIELLEGKREQLAATPSIVPAAGWITSGYGYRTSPFTGRRQFHSGLDIAADFGTPIVAPASGRVSFVGRKGALGKTVELDHGFGVKTTYGHLAEIFVKRGEKVDRGQRIAGVGSTGRSTGPHLHYVVSVRGKTTNPGDYILD